ncbi:MAG: hypothetical protein IT559_01895 [Alphaproteobacteria bacterium]|nr:hypothetical protein [Alphaproteobacteria bacterium]
MKIRDEKLRAAIDLDAGFVPHIGDTFRIGSKTFGEGLQAAEIQEAALDGKIGINPEAAADLADRVRGIYAHFSSIYKGYSFTEFDEPLQPFGMILPLFTCKNRSSGRVSYFHIDQRPLTCHFAIAGAPLSLYKGDKHSGPIAYWVDKIEGTKTHHAKELSALEAEEGEGLAALGDVVIMKGYAKGQRSLCRKYPYMNPENTGGLHRSNPRIASDGQASIILW